MKRFYFSIVITALLAITIVFEFFTDFSVATIYPANLLFNHNMHVVVPGKVYRSGTLPASELKRFIGDYNIRSVIDLRRGEDRAVPSEQDIVSDLGVAYAKVPLNAASMPGRERVLYLLDLFATLPQPVLMHCNSGTHRSGIASALWLLDQEQGSFEQAAMQLAPRFGFFRIERRLKALVTGLPTIDQLLWQYGQSSENDRNSFRQWAEQTLPSEPEFSKLSIPQSLPVKTSSPKALSH